MSNKNLKVGQEVASFEFTIEKGKLREVALAIGDLNPIYLDSDAAKEIGYQDVVAQPTFGFIMGLWGGADFDVLVRELDMNPIKVLHGEQEFLYYDEINPGEVLSAHCKLKNLEEKKSMYVFGLETEYFNQEGELVLISRSTIIERK
ncbi:MaoC family dehydratase N-terminal domain-containing protein [Desulfosporosinus sp. BICA1-9]|uniref:FAS1-like dehydratase domain-containing protein n=1 Tax=Desulfosporosinus sp. BICA1-9 TaxID=1531958 RepID=UPI00054C0445|nr:MaoC family dehydratase N-terminal domain-containing protein [Desulfosporosinus sp. BICA1-9]KJS46092.1 MAG: hypothetical protein VR66_27350 [Peptococcaceae bacterium BRH_c23]KJS88535.1 MAG: hypothetical protein JL57_12000 [Desulfosporosinus sp. BICA1-9]HBW35139.1 MaoC family dehydratase [Desulfosporosinus sp.]